MMPEVEESLDSSRWGETIRSLRKEKEWTQAELAGRLEVHPQAISEIERGREHLTLERLSRLLAALGHRGQICISEKEHDTDTD